jgi:chemotaxis protein MotB
MIVFFKSILRLVFIIGAIFLFITSCASHKNCDAGGSNKKFHSKRYRMAIHERDSLCSLTKALNDQLAKANSNYEELSLKFEGLKKSMGSEVSKLNSDLGRLSTDLGNKQATLEQREARLRQLESVLRKQDSLLNKLNSSVKNALLGFSPDELSVEMRDGKVYVSLSDKLLFKSGDANVEMKGKEALKKLAEVLEKNQDVSIAIEGHTDNVPIKTSLYKDNWDLSTARATNVVRLLTNEYRMDARRLTAAGKGEYFPVADNSTPEGKAKNRRTEIVLSPKLEELMKLITTNYNPPK